MIKVLKKVDLSPWTTLRIPQLAEFLTIVKTEADLEAALDWAREKQLAIFILGGGSNLLLTKPVKGLVIKNEIKGVALAQVSEKQVLVKAYSGENWTKLVDFTVKQGLSGLENLALIYGTVGAAPIQNIGAYGVELKDVFYELEAINLKTGELKVFKKADCQFAYRDSIFKNSLRDQYFIYSVTLKLSRSAKLNLKYGAIKAELEKRQINHPQAADVAKVVKMIRRRKLPNPERLPNAGSYFKNVEIGLAKYQALKKKYPELPSYPVSERLVKIPSGWLIEQAGFKGQRFGPVGMYEKQALVLVNYGGATAKQVMALANQVKRAVKKKFGLDIVEEVRVR